MSERQEPPGVPSGNDAHTVAAGAGPGAAPTSLLAGRYRVERVIGQGAFGRVYLAFDSRLRRNVAVKELLADRTRTDAATYERYLERFQREARAAGVVQHPNIVAVYELAIDADENNYLMMEYVDGTDLRDLLTQVGTLPVERAVTIGLEVARALEVVHEQDIVHRDVKPANIMVTRRGVTKLTDFGIAQVGQESQRTQVVSGHPGTPIYMSPEQGSGTGYLDGRSDLYSLGMVLYEMLVGAPYARKRQGLGEARPDLSPELVGIVTKLMAREVEARYQDAGAVVAALGALSSRQPSAGTVEVVSPLPAGEPRFGGPGTGSGTIPPPQGVPGVYGGAASQSQPGAPMYTGVTPPPTPPSPYGTGYASPYTPPPGGNGRTSKRGLWIGLGIAGIAVVLAVIGVVALTGKPKSATVTVSPSGSTAIAATTAGTAAGGGGTAGTVAVGSPVPGNTFVVADAKNLITYAYPKEWKAGGVSALDIDLAAGYTNFNPYGIVLIAKEDITASTTLDGYTDDVIARRFRKSPDWKPGPINKRNAMIAGQEARIIDFLQPVTTDGGIAPKGGTVYQYLIITLHDNRAWTVGYATAIDQQDTFQKQYDIVANTFTFCPTTGCTRAQTVPTITPGQTTKWVDPAKLLTAEYPADWLEYPPDKALGRTLALSSPDGVFFNIYTVNQAGTLDQEMRFILDSQTNDPDSKYTDAPVTDVQVGGESGKFVSYTYVPKNDPGAKARNGLTWIVNRGGKEFVFSGDDIKSHRGDVEKIISSVVFTGPAATPANRATPVPTVRPTPQVTPTQAAPTTRATPVGGYSADFSKWATDEVAGKYRRGFNAATGEYRIALLQENGGFFFPAPDLQQNVADFMLDVDVRQTGGPDAGQYGVVFRLQPQGANDKGRQYYYFLIDGQGRYGLFLNGTDNLFTVVQKFTAGPSGVIKTGANAVNHLTVICKGDKITLVVNDTMLGSYTATLTQPGNIGLDVSAPPNVNGLEAAFKNLRLSPP